ncbi:MAG: glycosyltransferase family 4 protein [Bdellovibrionales bacterium]|nr:glycosyltransferase family 4 protein [Bdellovibrionales bacterium]
MRVLMLYHYIDIPESHVISKLHSTGFQLKILCHPKSPNQDKLSKLGIEPVHFAFKSRFSVSAVKKINSLVSDFKPQIIHAFSGRAISNSVILSYFLKNRPKLLAYRGAVGEISRLDPANWFTFLNSKVDMICCVSKDIEKGLLKSGIPAGRLCTIYKGHDPAWYNSNSSVTREELNIPKNAFIIGCIANFRKNKGADLLVEAVKNLSTSLPEVKLIFIGKDKKNSIKKISSATEVKDKVIFLGFQEKPTTYLSLFDVFVMPSRKSEGLPKSVIEAMACKVPCIVSNVGGMPELIRDQIDGIVFKEDNSKELSNAILKLAANSDLRKQFAESAFDRILNNFGIDATLNATINLYNLMISNI